MSVERELSNLDLSKAAGSDSVSAKLLKIAAPIVAGPLTSILNASIRGGKFPDIWKLAKVSPIFKATDLTNKNNFRPISVLCILSKILERHVHDSLYVYMKPHLYIGQSGFREGHSCETALARLVDMWTTNMSKGLLTGVVFLDLRKAFDLVDHEVLLEKLKLYQFDDVALSWFRSYITGRTQKVFFKGKESQTLPVKSGVPQGSILGPLLFLIHMNDLQLHTGSSHLDMFADDSTVHASGNTVSSLRDSLNNSMVGIKSWCNNNKMAINNGKTKSMLVTTRQKCKRLPSQNLNINLDEENLDQVECDKILGVTIDTHLSWNEHINNVARKVSQNIGLLRRIRQYLPTFARRTFYMAYIQPHFDYCSIIWGQADISRLIKLQKLALRTMADAPSRTPSHGLFKQFGIMPLKSRIDFRTTSMVFKAVNGNTPSYISDMFECISNVSSRQTRATTRGDIYIPKAKLTAQSKTLRYTGAKLYNESPTDLRNSPTLASFKSKYVKSFFKDF